LNTGSSNKHAGLTNQITRYKYMLRCWEADEITMNNSMSKTRPVVYISRTESFSACHRLHR